PEKRVNMSSPEYYCIGKRLHKAEGIVEGMLMMLGVRLEMDRYVERELPGGRTSVFYQRKNSLRS
ncbi:hypothetical protein QQ559_005283, partial [Escherichia coli]|nr:hypothetical protein [Escherichia coli]